MNANSKCYFSCFIVNLISVISRMEEIGLRLPCLHFQVYLAFYRPSIREYCKKNSGCIEVALKAMVHARMTYKGDSI